ncbi:subtilisin-like serine protease QhpE [Pseudomonas putida]|uniref:subtilisin-like serine protease QhpE n=1 Tax=Pseudomonas putida TaxID=303 RepID=UPI002365AD97|nr:S8 family serine peptidase [Pseudomonas putida]MDD2047705.1 peptidase S8 and S53 subtilisin kexin sedolisin [Pseudomonas putida]
MTNELCVGVIDSGCSAQQAQYLTGGRRFWLEQDSLRQGELQADALGHGSAVLERLLAQSDGLSVKVAQVFDSRGATSVLQVSAALLWLVEQGVSLVNLSLGLAQDRAVLRQACAVAVEAGVLLCASSPARGAPVYPASYPGVLRITGDARCEAGQWSWLDTAQADFGAAVGEGAGTAGASLACAALSGQIATYLRDYRQATREQVLAYLRDNAAFIGPERRGGGHG